MIEILQGKKQKEAALYPSRLDVLREYNGRRTLSEKYIEELRRLEAGYQGEQLVLDYLNEFGHSDWKVVKNLWLDNDSIFECDLLLITRLYWYTIEIKNFAGQYKLENGQWSCYGNYLPNNPISQAQRVAVHFEQLTRMHKLPIVVKGAIVFTGNHFDLDLVDTIQGVEILQINQLRDFIKDIAWKERNANKRVDSSGVLQFIAQYETDNPFPAEDLYDELGDKLEKGVRCCRCGSFDLDLKNSYISCRCGMHEPREMAIVRTICEYGVMRFNKDFTTKEVVDFFDGDFSTATIRKYLNKYFDRYGIGSGTRYYNKKMHFKILSQLFNFVRKCFFVISGSNEA